MSLTLNSARAQAYAAARFLDAWDEQGSKCGLSVEEYRKSAGTLVDILTAAPSRYMYSDLIRHSPAAQEIAEGIEIERRIAGNRPANFPVLDTLLGRI